MKIIYLFLLFPTLLFCQESNNYKLVIKKFYKVLYDNSCTIKEFSEIYSHASIEEDIPCYLKDSLNVSWRQLSQKLKIRKIQETNSKIKKSYIHEKLKKSFFKINFKLSLSEINKVIENGEVYNDGLQFTDYFILSFDKNDKLYFELNKDNPTQILNIWLKDGKSFEDNLFGYLNPQKLLLSGMINDLDGYVNIRSKPNKESNIVGKFKKEEILYYVPNLDCNWWLVSKYDNSNKIIGYVNKDKITEYKKLSTKLKNKIRDSRN